MRLLKFFAKSTKEEAGEGSENGKKNLLSQARCTCGWPQRYFGSIIWNSLPIEIREDLILWSVTKIKQWERMTCPCTIWKSYKGRVLLKYLNHGLKTFDKSLKILKIFGISVLPIFNVHVHSYLIYIDLPFDGCFMTFVIYNLDVFIAQMDLWCK